MKYQIPALIAVFAILFLGIFAIGGYLESKNPGLFVLSNKTPIKPVTNTNLNANLNTNIKPITNTNLTNLEVDFEKNINVELIKDWMQSRNGCNFEGEYYVFKEGQNLLLPLIILDIKEVHDLNNVVRLEHYLAPQNEKTSILLNLGETKTLPNNYNVCLDSIKREYAIIKIQYKDKKLTKMFEHMKETFKTKHNEYPHLSKTTSLRSCPAGYYLMNQSCTITSTNNRNAETKINILDTYYKNFNVSETLIDMPIAATCEITNIDANDDVTATFDIYCKRFY